MLLLLFQAGAERYALDAATIVEVLPLLEIRPIPHAPQGVAGVFDFRGTPVPVVDSSFLLCGKPAEHRFSTRITVVNYPDGSGGTRPLGVIVERASRTVRRDPAEFSDTGVNNGRAPYLGPVMRDADGMVQWIDVGRLLPADVRDVLFKPHMNPSWPPPISKAS